jgi:uncharacterized membrane protein
MSRNQRSEQCKLILTSQTSVSPVGADVLRIDQSWRRAISYSLKVLGFSIIWLVVGLALIFSGISLIPSALRFGPGALLGGVALLVIGYLLIYAGILVAMFRYLPRAIAEEMKK